MCWFYTLAAGLVCLVVGIGIGFTLRDVYTQD